MVSTYWAVRSKQWVSRCAIAAVLACLGASVARALVVASLNPNTSAPPGCPGFDNVGRFPLDVFGQPAGGTFVYLGTNSDGEEWCVTAYHLGAPDGGLLGGGLPLVVQLHGQIHPVDTSSLVQVGGVNSDVCVFRIFLDPGLPNLRISCRTVPLGGHFFMVGSGWFETSTDTRNGDFGYVLGYSTDASYPYIRWAENINLGSYGPGQVYSNFDDSLHGGLPDEGQAMTWDSGGAIFGDGVNGSLSGIITGRARGRSCCRYHFFCDILIFLRRVVPTWPRIVPRSFKSPGSEA